MACTSSAPGDPGGGASGNPPSKTGIGGAGTTALTPEGGLVATAGRGAQGGQSGASGTAGSESAAAGTSMHGGQAGASGNATEGGIAVLVEYLPDGAVDCRRDVSLAAVAVEPPPPFDLIIVADHSDSLSWSRDALSSGLRELLSDVQGRSARVFLLTPTQYGASSEAAQIPLSGSYVVPWEDPATGQAYTNAMTTYTQSCTDPAGKTIACPSAKGSQPYKAEGVWHFDMPQPIAVLTPELTSAQFAAQQDAVRAAILAISGTGSPKEQPLCTLSRYVSQPSSSLPDHAVFLIISDEDDTSFPKECLVGYSSELQSTMVERTWNPCSANCDTYRYDMQNQYALQRFEYHCQFIDDLGKASPETDVKSWLNEGVVTCGSSPDGACSDAESKRAGALCPAGYSIVSCSRQCSATTQDCILDIADGTTDICVAPFTYNGAQYTNFADYCSKVYGGQWNSCKGGGITKVFGESITGGYSSKSLMSGTSTADISRYFRSQADAAFGANDYSVEAIVLDPAFSCGVESGQSYANNIVAMVGDRSKVFPLCASYAPALQHVWDFAQNLIETEFSISLKPDEHVTSVSIVAKDGSERVLDAAAFHYDSTKQTLTVQRDSLGNGAAKLRVEITSDCRPIIH